MRAVTTAEKGGYTAALHNIYSGPPPPPEEHHEAINQINTIVQGINKQSYDLEVLEQANGVLTSSNSKVMAQLSHINLTMNTMQVQLKILSSEKTNPNKTKRTYYCWNCGINFTHESKTCSAKKAGHKEETCYKKRLGGSERGRK